MSKLLDKLIPEILIYKCLGEELEALRETFDRNWDEKRDGWRDETIEWLAKRVDTECEELERAIKEMREDAFLHSTLIYRTKRVHSEWLDVALVALMGADKTRREYESLEKRQKKGPTIEAPEPELVDSEHERIHDSMEAHEDAAESDIAPDRMELGADCISLTGYGRISRSTPPEEPPPHAVSMFPVPVDEDGEPLEAEQEGELDKLDTLLIQPLVITEELTEYETEIVVDGEVKILPLLDEDGELLKAKPREEEL